MADLVRSAQKSSYLLDIYMIQQRRVNFRGKETVQLLGRNAVVFPKL